MATAEANINKETLGFICSQIGITTVFLSQRTGHTQEKICAWLDSSNGDEFPTINQAKNLAKYSHIGYVEKMQKYTQAIICTVRAMSKSLCKFAFKSDIIVLGRCLLG